ncbi:Structural maintenance of chromosomes protein 2 [Gaertneriomyces sp. JEL0708]|nr:Structural maintenance of chromosomes protein 2 [Gaertneriomyces sp. JEL0708]
MFVEELIIEGFKSYATRTVISGWDPQFNAITGLNGSGKSNILDAICFVLGISTLSHVRANNLQDLVYKRGQAGISKASVTIVFNNEDRDRSPPGYENNKQISVTRQIIVNGRNKYIVNGHNKNQQDVANLFQSIQLNVNNPHFLIMQGRITKVLNMKPPEILAMIEEAAGTRMFEDRKEKAFKTMAKKEAKLEEISNLLQVEIGPKLEKLREAKRTFLEYQKTVAELDHLRRLLIAYEYAQYEHKLQTSEQDLQDKKDRIATLTNMQAVLQEDMNQINRKLSEIASDRENDSATLKKLESVFKDCSKELVRVKTQCDLKRSNTVEEQSNRSALVKEKTEAEQSLVESRRKHEKLKAGYEASVKEHEAKADRLREQENLIQTLSTGMSAKEGQEGGYQAQLQDANKAITAAASEAEQAKIKMNHLKRELQESLPKARAAEKENSSLIADLKANKKIVEMMMSELKSLHFEPDRDMELMRQKQTIQATVNELRERVDELERELIALQFSYADPTPNFDRRKVKGLVAELVSVPKHCVDAATALEVGAGGRLYNVVVETEVVGTQLLQKGRLRRRVTIIPLNKISASKLSPDRLAAAQTLAPGKVDLALNLIGYDHEVEAAMEYVFAGTLICQDAETAKKVTFDRAVRTRSITLEGDSYDPQGSLSGGSKPNTAGVLLKIGALRDLRQKLAEHEKALAEVMRGLEESTRITNHYKGLRQKLDLKDHEGKLLEERLSSNANAQIIHHTEGLRKQLEEQDSIRRECIERRAAAVERRAHIEKEMREFADHRDEKLKSLKTELAKGKAELAKAAPSMKKVQQAIDIAKEETAQIEMELVKLDEQIAQVDKAIMDSMKEEELLQTKMAEIKRSYDVAETKLENERKSLSAFDKQTESLESAKREKKQLLEDCKLEVRKLSHDLDKFNSEQAQAARIMKELLRKSPWIPDHKHLFGKAGTDYDFRKHDLGEINKRVKQLGERNKVLERNLDHQVMDKYDRVEKKETQLKQMLSTVQKDKRKIQETIAELDKYKKEALRKTWEKVNVDFGAIFADLLPGNSSKLEPPEGQDITDGLEVKVALGGIWKHSLTELSGGQRSLIALSLILSLLQYKPAPMYILDEVDSALDLSHTQNIGQLIRTRFKGSQFIIVSLKDGMFNNANVLFKTKFREGVSTVERIAQRDKESRAAASAKKVHRGAAGTPRLRN